MYDIAAFHSTLKSKLEKLFGYTNSYGFRATATQLKTCPEYGKLTDVFLYGEICKRNTIATDLPEESPISRT